MGELKNRVKLGEAIRKDLAEWVKRYSDDTGIPISKVIDKALECYIEKSSTNAASLK